MEATERLQLIAQQCRTRYYAFPESLITAICHYVSGAGSFATIQQEWQAARQTHDFFVSVLLLSPTLLPSAWTKWTCACWTSV